MGTFLPWYLSTSKHAPVLLPHFRLILETNSSPLHDFGQHVSCFVFPSCALPPLLTAPAPTCPSRLCAPANHNNQSANQFANQSAQLPHCRLADREPRACPIIAVKPPQSLPPSRYRLPETPQCSVAERSPPPPTTLLPDLIPRSPMFPN